VIGEVVSHYKILAKLGEGGMGIVYKATDTRLDRLVALKFLPPHVSTASSELERFTQEARAAAALNHPSICTIHDIEEANDQHFIVMEFVEGQTLQQEESQLPTQQVIAIASQIAEGLQAAHKKGIVHRDIKNSNIMLTPEGQVKIMDFGLAKSAAASMVTKTGTTIGTVPFMSPEQARGERVDHRTDIWSLGVVLYSVIAGRLPFLGEYSDALVYLILNESPPPLSSLRSDVPEALEQIVKKCLEKDPDHRYQDMSEFLVDLHRLQGTPIGVSLSWALVRKRLLRPRWAALGAVAFLLTVSLVLGPQFFLGTDDIIDSIAVLPLENLSGDPEQDYLAAGLHEALITDLAKLTGFHRVIARTSVKRFQHTTLSVAEISRELGVDALLTGSVVRSGDRVQVTAHLIRSSSEEPMWSDRFEREFNDVLSLQKEIVETLAGQIRLQLTPEEQTQLQSVQTVNPDAYENYLKGRFEYLKQTPEAFDKAEHYFHAALEKDPNFALAYGGLALVWMMRGDAGFQPPSETFPRGMALIEKALELDSTSADIRVMIASTRAGMQWDWSGAEQAYREAIRLNPNNAGAHFFLGDLLLAIGRTEEWEKEVLRGLELDPLNDFTRSFYGWHLNYVGRYDEAIPIFLELRETGPNKASNHLGLWGAYFKQGKYAEAATCAKDYFLEIGDSEFAKSLGSPTSEAEYRAAMKRTGELMAKHSKERHVPAIRIARMFAHAAQNDMAIYWLEKAVEAKESPVMRLGVFWDWDGLRSEPRFQDILRRVKLAPG
jgi:serine/threonine protein kinase/Tfp pilus assembly protein PilF